MSIQRPPSFTPQRGPVTTAADDGSDETATLRRLLHASAVLVPNATVTDITSWPDCRLHRPLDSLEQQVRRWALCTGSATGSRHAAHLEQPDAFLSVLRSWLSRHDR